MKEHILYSTIGILVLGLFIFGGAFILPLISKGVSIAHCAGAKLAWTAPWKHIGCGGEKRK